MHASTLPQSLLSTHEPPHAMGTVLAIATRAPMFVMDTAAASRASSLTFLRFCSVIGCLPLSQDVRGTVSGVASRGCRRRKDPPSVRGPDARTSLFVDRSPRRQGHARVQNSTRQVRTRLGFLPEELLHRTGTKATGAVRTDPDLPPKTGTPIAALPPAGGCCDVWDRARRGRTVPSADRCRGNPQGHGTSYATPSVMTPAAGFGESQLARGIDQDSRAGR
jgi:hypothetical protein